MCAAAEKSAGELAKQPLTVSELGVHASIDWSVESLILSF